MAEWRELPIVRALTRGATRQRLIAAVSYFFLLIVSCEDPLAPDSSSVRIQADPAALSIIIGETRTITARVIDGEGATVRGARVFWSTDNVAVATVSQLGMVTGITPGTARISASSRGKSTIVSVTVRPRPTALVRVTPPTSTIREGEFVTLHAEPVDASGDVVTGRPVQWTSSNDALATVSSTGIVTGVSAGRATITATVDGVSGSAGVTVESAPVATVSVTPTIANIFVGRSLQLSATTADSLGRPLSGRRIIWASNAPAVASVSSTGQVIGLAPGTATITAISEGRSGSSQITVALVPVAAVSVIPGSATLSIGRSATLFARLIDADGEVLSGRAVTWVSDQPSVVSVMADGVITAVSIGKARITATAEGKSGSAIIDVAALSVSGLTVSPNAVS
ncbi:MAG TPA: Ig-like domain-containing protein, partial [Gemmatimonadaceae bacterium]